VETQLILCPKIEHEGCKGPAPARETHASTGILPLKRIDEPHLSPCRFKRGPEYADDRAAIQDRSFGCIISCYFAKEFAYRKAGHGCGYVPAGHHQTAPVVGRLSIDNANELRIEAGAPVIGKMKSQAPVLDDQNSVAASRLPRACLIGMNNKSFHADAIQHAHDRDRFVEIK